MDVVGDTETVDAVDFDNIASPIKLYDILGNAHIRAKYEKRLMVILVGFEEKCLAKEQVLLSLDDFFQGTKTITTEKLMMELESGTIDLEESTICFKSAIETTTQAATKLTSIAKEISQILTLAAAFPDNKKGRKKLEKALMKAQDDIRQMSETLHTIKEELEKSKEGYNDTKKTLEAKSAECNKLQMTTNQVKVSNASLKAELSSVMATLKKTQEEFDSFKTSPTIYAAEVKELKLALDLSQRTCNDLCLEKDQCKTELEDTIHTLKIQHQKEIEDMQSQHEEQLQLLKTKFQDEAELAKYDKDMKQIEEDNLEDYQEENDFGEEKVEEDEEIAEVSDPGSIDLLGMSHGEAIAIATLQKEHVEKENALKSEIQALRSKSKKIIASLQAELVETQDKLANISKETFSELTSDLERQRDEVKNELSQVQKEKDQLLELNSQQEMKVTQLEKVIQNLEHDVQSSANNRLMRDTATHSTQWSEPSNVAIMSSHSVISKTPSIPMEEIIHSHSPSIHASPRSPQSPQVTKVPPVILPCASPQQSQGRSSPFISFDHPLVQDWIKVCETVMKFKGKLMGMIKRHSLTHTANDEIFQDLRNETNLHLDRSKELQGQVTQMRFTVSLVLHQLEDVLHEYLSSPPTHSIIQPEEPQLPDVTIQLRADVAKVRQQIHQTEEQELSDNHDTISNLSMKIDDLKSEISHLRQLLNHSNAGLATIFFTRLDACRNEKALLEAKKSNQITEGDYESITSNMNEYVTIPGQQFQSIAHQLCEETQVKKAIVSVCQSFSSPEHTSRVITMILQLQAKRQKSFCQAMGRLSAKRLQVAKDLQVSLTKTEKHTGLFFVKPIYPTQQYSALLIPLQRVPPMHTGHTHSSHLPSRSLPRRTTETHPALRLIHEIRSSVSSYQQFRGSPKFSLQVPHSEQHMNASHNWPVARSRAHSATASPVIPKLVELEISRLREPLSLLKRYHQQKSGTGRAREQAPPTSVALPPIHIPSH